MIEWTLDLSESICGGLLNSLMECIKLEYWSVMKRSGEVRLDGELLAGIEETSNGNE